ncbi:MAG: butyrate kinase [Candidatus Hatepunaea meridiana]|nr:butyrate kinase [Candidatus Hatepunaea meridiana]
MLETVIVINPGSTSTKFALWSRDKCVVEKVVRHERSQLAAKVADQFDYRRELIDAELDTLLEGVTIVGAVGRGGPMKPIHGGTYSANTAMLDDLKSGRYANHASNLGAMLADHYARRFGVKAYVVDPVTVDEFTDVARLSGVPWIKRKSRAHALNIKAVIRRAADEIGKELPDTAFVVAHLGGGISIAAVKAGYIIDVNDGLHGMGPYSPERAGALPIGPVVERCFSGKITREELLDELGRRGGLMAYLGTSDVREVLERISKGDKEADLVLSGMIYQIAKEIGAMATVLQGKLDAVIITGGLAHSDEIISMIEPYISYIAKMMVFPGEGELQALAEGAFRVIDGVEEAREY